MPALAHIRPADMTPSADAVVAEVVRGLCTSTAFNGRHVVNMPIVSAFGGGIAVTVWHEGGDKFMVTDDGTAYAECANACASDRTFSAVAREKAERYGAQFDGCSMLFLRVGREGLAGAITAMGSLTKEVIDDVIDKSFAAKVDIHRERFIKAAHEAFSGYELVEEAQVMGQSTAMHRVDLLVDVDGRKIAFEHFSKAHVAISSAFVMLSDLARLDEGPRPVGVTPSFDLIGPKLTLLASVASIIESDTPPDRIRSLATAA